MVAEANEQSAVSRPAFLVGMVATGVAASFSVATLNARSFWRRAKTSSKASRFASVLMRQHLREDLYLYNLF
jgi:hypothetical protein